MDRKAIYTFLESAEGGADVLVSLKTILNSLDNEAKENRELASSLKVKLEDSEGKLTELSEKASQVEGLQQGKSEIEQRLGAVEKLLETKEKEAEALAAREKDREIKDHFRSKASNFFKSNIDDVITLASSGKGFSSKDGQYLYGELSGDEAIEAMKADFKRYGIGESGTGSTGGSPFEPVKKVQEKAHDGFVAALTNK